MIGYTLRCKICRTVVGYHKPLRAVGRFRLFNSLAMAARDLAAYDEPEVEEALIRVGADSSTPNTVATSCGEALAEIWLRKKQLNLEALQRLQGAACHEATGLIRLREPSWASKIA